jgi:iron complex outermembrane recepter protein
MKRMRTRLLASSMITGATVLAAATSAFAADAGAAPASDTAVGEVVVTGSRIPQPNLTSVSPVTAVGAQEMQFRGTSNVSDLLNSLPQAYVDQSGGASNGASGTATVNLRNLGSVRTLVLVDGTRLPPADTAAPSPDLNMIPSALVDRVEVLTGGASAVYGSDAVAGVVNFIMKKNLEGIRVDAQYGFYQHGQHNSAMQALLNSNGTAIPADAADGGTATVSVALGVNAPDDKGNITAYFGYSHTNAVTQDKRDYSACAILTNSGDDSHLCGGSTTVPQGKFQRVDIPGQAKYFGTSTGALASSAPLYNYAPTNYYQRPDERYQAGYYAHYDINEHLEVYSNLMFSDDHTFAQIAPSGLFNGVTYQVNCDNPFLSADAQGKLCNAPVTNNTVGLFIGRRTTELGPRTDDLRHTAYRVNFGLKGAITDGWSYDVYGQFADTIYQERYTGEVSIARAQKALLVENTPSGPQCRSVIDGSDPLCAPLNIFTTNSISQAALNYIAGTGLKEGSATEQVVSGSVTGDLGRYGIKSPWSTEGVGIALGAEYRREAISVNVDQEFSTGDLAGQGGQTPSVAGSFDVKEIFGELRVPIAEHQAFADRLSLDLGYRYSDYSNVGGTNTYKIGGEWAPIPDIKFRAAFNRAVRAPNTVELFSGFAYKLYSGTDPCANDFGKTPSASQAACAAQGVMPDIGGGVGANGKTAYGFVIQCPASQCTQLTTGNPDLTPETSDTKTFGIVFTPTFFRGFTATVDYFDINVKNLINTYGATTIVNKCLTAYGTATGNFFCGQIHRDATTNVLFGTGYVFNGNVNTGFVHTKGIDFEATYKTSLEDMHMGDHGSLTFNFAGTYTHSYVIQPDARIGQYDCVGFFGPNCSNVSGNGGGDPIPVWRHRVRITWDTGWKGLTVSGAWRHINALKPELASTNPLIGNVGGPLYGGADPVDNIPSYDYFDLAATWRVKDNVTLRAGINNIFDRDPPVVDQSNIGLSGPPEGNGNTFPGIYDALGRTIFMGVTANF